MTGRGITPPAQEQQNVSNANSKLRKPPPVTPKRFTKFFTPRSSASRVSKLTGSRAGRQLRDITHQSALNSRTGPSRYRSPNKKTVAFQDLNELPKALHTPNLSSRKRKSYATPESSPPQQSSPCKRVCSDDVIPSSPPAYLDNLPVYAQERSISPERTPLPVIRRATAGNSTARILQRSFGGAEYITRGRRRDNCIRLLDSS
jgi:hypothetical protein